MIEIRGVTKRFGRVVALEGVDVAVNAGDSTALWGHNGAGKTTLIRCMLGVTSFEGTVIVDGIDVRKDGKRARERIGYVPQELAFHDDTRLRTAMAFFAGLRRVGRAESRAALRAVELEGHEAKRLRELSGGMKQRLAMAIALLSDPPVIVLDEPTSNLDAAGRRDMVHSLQQLRSRGKTLVFASHRPDEVAALADDVLILDGGRASHMAKPAELWPDEAGDSKLRLQVPANEEERALAALRDAGHTAELNGNGLCAFTPRDRKGAPIVTLARAEIEVQDFEFVVEPPAKGGER